MIPAKLLELNFYLPHHIIIFTIFAVLYHLLKGEEDKEQFKTMEDALYFSVINHFTVGFGDITPKSKTLRRLCMLQILVAFLFFAN